MQIKVCGLTTAADITALASMNINRMGFIFYPKSPRYMHGKIAKENLALIPTHIKKTGVFVNAEIEEIEKMIAFYTLDSIQLHGDETPHFCKYFMKKTEVIKTISIKNELSFELAKTYHDACHLFLFDTQSENYGGTGVSFNWQWLKAYTLEKPFYVSGGISLENCSQINSITNMYLIGIDINSKFETSPGIKNTEKIQQLISLFTA